MRVQKSAIVYVATLFLPSSCSQNDHQADHPSAPEGAEPGIEAGAASTSSIEAGSDVYGSDCDARMGIYSIRLTKGDDGFVSAQVVSKKGRFENLLTSYSYMGGNTPPDLLIAIMFDAINAPVPD